METGGKALRTSKLRPRDSAVQNPGKAFRSAPFRSDQLLWFRSDDRSGFGIGQVENHYVGNSLPRFDRIGGLFSDDLYTAALLNLPVERYEVSSKAFIDDLRTPTSSADLSD